jgi:ribose-phosphate pyrophosphokinase
MNYTIHYPEDAGKKFEMFRYPAGEVQVRFTPEQLDEMAGADEIHIFARIKDGEIMGLAMLKDALRLSYIPVKLFLPYLPYSRADRAFTDGDCFGLHVFADLLNRLDFDQVITLDAHSSIAEVEIDNLLNVSAYPFILECVGEDTGILLPDKGSTKRYPIRTNLVAEKNRDVSTGKLTGFTVPSKDAFGKTKSILLVDDICDGGGTFIGIAEAMKDYGIELNLYVTHGIFSRGLTWLFSRFNKIYTTDSFGTSIHAAPEDKDRLIILPCEELMVRAAHESEIFNRGI